MGNWRGGTFVKAYDQARRAITFLRWEQSDMETISPSLYAGRGGGKRRVAESSEQPVSAPAVQPAPEAPVTASASSAGTQQAPALGLPGGNPFSA